MFDWFQTPTQAHDTLTDSFFSPSLSSELPKLIREFANLVFSFTKGFNPLQDRILLVKTQIKQILYSDLLHVCLKASFTWNYENNSPISPPNAAPLVKIQLSCGEVVASVPILHNTKLIEADYKRESCHWVGYTIDDIKCHWLCMRMVPA